MIKMVPRLGLTTALLCLTMLVGTSAAAQETLTGVLTQAYQVNPTIQSARARLRAIDELLPEAQAGRLPKLEIGADARRQMIDANVASGTYNLNSSALSVGVTQPVYQGGRIYSRIRAAENRIRAARAILLSTEQSVLLAAATAFMDIVRDQAILDLQLNYRNVLQERLRIENQRMKNGVNNKTDVSQAESRMARAISERIGAETALQNSTADFVRIVGNHPGSIHRPNLAFDLPESLDDAIELARANNPDVTTAKFLELASRDDVDTADGELLPRVELFGSVSRSIHPSNLIDAQDGAIFGVQIKIPLDDGSASARARGARQNTAYRIHQIDEETARVVGGTVKAWNNLTAARSSVTAREAEIRSAEITLASLRDEVDFGARTVTDLLNAEQDALASRLSLTQAQHAEVVNAIQLLVAVGRMTAQSIQLPVDYYDHEAHYNRVRGKIWGVSLPGDPK